MGYEGKSLWVYAVVFCLEVMPPKDHSEASNLPVNGSGFIPTGLLESLSKNKTLQLTPFERVFVTINLQNIDQESTKL